MATRYTPEELKFLRESPLVVKPPNLPPPEQWMGPPAEQTRNPNSRGKNADLSQSPDQVRRPGLERLTSKTTTNPEDIILGPPKTSFMSTRSSSFVNKSIDSPDRPSLRPNDSKDRFGSYRNERSDLDLERLRESKANNSRVSRRGGDDDDSEGWNKVKPRKSFGTEGAERFANGRMGAQKDERRYRDRDDRDKDRPRTFEHYSRDSRDAKESDDNDRDRENRLSRNGMGRGRAETTWREREANKDRENEVPSTPRDRNSNGDRFADRDRNRGWREKDKEDADKDRRNPRSDFRDREPRRWGRDQPEEKEPEWNSQPSEGRSKVHTAEDFQKWKEQMHQEKGSGGRAVPGAEEDRFKPDAGASFFGLEKDKVETPLSLDTGPDKFFGNWGAKEEANTDAALEPKVENPVKAKTTGKSSRFTSFFSPQEESQRRLTEPPPIPASVPPSNGLEALFGRPSAPSNETSNPSSDQEGIQRLLQQLKLQQPAQPRPNPGPQIPRPALEQQTNLPAESPDPYLHYRQDRVEDHRPPTRHQQSAQDIMAQRQLAGSQSSNRQEQVLQELIAQRQNNSSQSSSRADQARDRNNADFLMGLMQSVRAAPEPQRDHLVHRVPPRPTDRQMQQQLLEREQIEMARERERAVQSQQQRRPPPPGFFEDPNSFQRSHLPQERQASGPPPQPTQILQRPPPGLDHAWENRPPPQLQQGAQQHRMNVPPPPGLQGGPANRGLPPNMFPPGFPVSNFPPDGMPPGPPRGMMQPPPGFFGGPGPGGPPLPGFLPPGVNGFQGVPEGMGFGPFDGRGPPPPQGFRR